MSGRNLDELERELAALRAEVERLGARGAWRRWLGGQLTRPAVRTAVVVATVAIPLAAWAVTIPNTFVNGQVADADEVNANFTALADSINLHEPDPSAHHTKTTSAAELTSGTLADARLSANVSLLGPGVDLGELAFDPATQTELDGHAAVPSAHHAKTLDAAELIGGTLADARLSANVSLLGPNVDVGELAFDPATQTELNVHASAPSAHHARYTNAEAIAAVGPHANLPNRILVAPSGGDFTSIQAAIDSVTPSASNPYLIDIAPGTYVEDLSLKSHIHLRGASRTGTVLQALTGGSNHVVLASDTGVDVSRLTLADTAGGSGPDRALFLSASELTLRDVRVEGYGLELVRAQTGSTLRVENSEFVDPFFNGDRGIYLLDSEAIISGSFFQTKDCAIEAERSALTLTTSEIADFQVCATGVAATPKAVHIENNRLNAVLIDGNARARIVGNDIDSDSGRVSLSSTEPAQVIGNRIYSEDFAAVTVDSGSEAEIVGNHIEGAGPGGDGIDNLGTARIVGNTISAGDDAVSDSGTALVVGNRMTTGGIMQSSNSVVIGNSVPGQTSVEGWVNPRGIQIESTSNAVVLEAGGSTVTLTSSGDVQIQADDVAIVASGDLDLSGTNVTISATKELELNAGTQIDANGTLINLN